MNQTYLIFGAIALVIILGVVVGVTVWICKRRKVQWEIDEEKETLLTKTTTQQYPPRSKQSTLNLKSDDEVLLAQMYIRSSFVNFKNPEVFPPAHRPEKNYFIVEAGKEQALMTMIPVGKNCPMITELNRASLFKVLKAIDHPFIWKTTEVDYHKEKNVVVVFRPLCPKGSIKDIIFGKNKKQMKPPSPEVPKRHTLNQPKKKIVKQDTVVIGKPLTEEKIAKWGRQILEGIQYLRVHKFPYCNLHVGNVLIDNQGNACITDHESQLLGLQMVYPYREIVDHYVQKGFDPDVVLFGSFLFETSVGYTMDSPVLHDFDIPADCPKAIKKLLSTIFPKEPPSEPVTIKQLLQDPFFASVVLYSEWKTHAIPMDARAKGLLDGFKPVFNDKPVTLTKQPSTSNTNNSNNNNNTLTKSTSNMSLSSVASGTDSTTSSPATQKKKKKKKASTMTAGAPAPTAPPPPPGGAPPPPPPISSPPPASSGRKGLLSSIENFDNKKLKKAKTVDKSKPKLK
mmetsp:Transcript_14963/g.20924  ORF Transcript_14963/g.20924 Transcript_14963/m.20924 type:complete len:511 (+) Transcript_14963:82-1614(+)